MAVDASVVVPVYNPGAAIDSCIASLLGQSLPADRLELIFSDDGSTDGTGAKLDRLAAEHPHVKVIHSPNSGWPGRPRNLGIAAATGEFIQFVDHDDALAPEALERLVAYGRENASDIVIGKVTSDFRTVPHRVFRTNIAACTIWDLQITSGLTPHKMFRRQFLLDTGIRYPEGKVRLEDQLFIMKTFFAASTVSVLSDYPCYFYQRRADGSNAAGQAVEPAVYYHYAREVLDVVIANTAPDDELRAVILRRFWRAAVDTCGKTAVRGRRPEHLEKLHSEALRLYDDYIPAEVEAALTPIRRAQAALLHAGDLQRLADLTAGSSLTRADVRLDAPHWTGTAWRGQLTARLVYEDGSPLTVVPSGAGWRPDPRIVPLDIDIAPQRLEEVIEDADAEVTLRHRHSGVRWFVPVDWTPQFEPVTADPAGPQQLVYTGVVELDPETVAVGGPLTQGKWDLFVSTHLFGIGATVSGGLQRDSRVELAAVLLRPRPRVASLRVPAQGRVSLVMRPLASLTSALASRVTAVSVSRGSMLATIAMPLRGGPATTKCVVVTGGRRLPATIRSGDSGTELRCSLVAGARLPRGRHVVSVAVAAGDEPQRIAELSVGRWGRVSVAG